MVVGMTTTTTTLETTLAPPPVRVRVANASFELGLIRGDCGWVPAQMRQEVLERDGHRCLRCEATETLEMDHVRPYRYGGRTLPRNLQTLCKSCNCWKGPRYADFRRVRPEATLGARVPPSGGNAGRGRTWSLLSGESSADKSRT